MRQIKLSISKFFLIVIILSIASYAQFIPGNLAVLRVGDGISTLANTGNAIFIDEYTITGTLVSTTPLPVTGSGLICLSGTATSEGQITLSPDGSYLTVVGYNPPSLPYSSSLSSSTSSAVPRIGYYVNSSKTLTLFGNTTAYFSGNNPRCGVYNGTNMWCVGGNSGVVVIDNGNNVVVSTTTTNIRNVQIINNQLYYSTGSGTRGVYAVGTGVPNTSGQTSTNIINSNLTGSSPYAFSINPAGTIAYLADDAASTGGIQRYDYSGGVWSLTYTITSPGLCRGLVVDWWSGANPIIYATTATTSLVKIIDVGASSTSTTLTTPGTNQVFRGVNFVPGTPLPVELTSFSAKQVGANVQLNWATATEVNSHKYVIEKSNFNNWSVIGEVKANGNSNSAKHYSFADKITTNGKFQYRLKMIDNDGSFKYSDIVEINVETPKAFELLQNSPNPFNPTTSIVYQLANTSDVTLKVYDILGNEVLTLVNEKQEAGKYEVKLDASKLSSGTYIYRLSAGSFIQTKKMILLK